MFFHMPRFSGQLDTRVVAGAAYLRKFFGREGLPPFQYTFPTFAPVVKTIH
jgi:hypothetical protein